MNMYEFLGSLFLATLLVFAGVVPVPVAAQPDCCPLPSSRPDPKESTGIGVPETSFPSTIQPRDGK